MQTEPSEQVVYQDKSVTITTARAILGGVTYSMANITSVRSFSERRPFAVLLVGVVALFSGYSCNQAKFDTLGPGLLVLGALMCIGFFLMKPKHWVRIGTAGAESNAVWSHDPRWTATVVNAINAAIVARG